jgi:hypothetical protein
VTSQVFAFDGVYADDPDNTMLYQAHVKKVMMSALDGVNGTVNNNCAKALAGYSIRFTR